MTDGEGHPCPQRVEPSEGILYHTEGMDLIPANIELSGIEINLVNVMRRELTLQNIILLVDFRKGISRFWLLREIYLWYDKVNKSKFIKMMELSYG